MCQCGETETKLAERVGRRRVLTRALALVGAAAGLSACKHLMGGAGANPVDRGDANDRDRTGGGMGGGSM